MLTRAEIVQVLKDYGIISGGDIFYRKIVNNKAVKNLILGSLYYHTSNCKSDKLIERVYWIVNELDDYPKQCISCNENITYFNSINDPYPTEYCSHKCSARSDKTKNRRRQTSLSRYGVDNPSKSKAVIKKIEDTHMRNYGVRSSLLDPRVRDKSIKTLVDRYGVDHNMKSKEIKDKAKETCFERYGAENVFDTIEFQEKARKTTKSRYGVSCVFQSEKFIESQTIARRNERYNNLVEKLRDSFEVLFDITEYRGLGEKYNFRCLMCGFVFNTSPSNFVKCYKCNPKYCSMSEIELSEYILGLGCSTIMNDRGIISPFELDIVIPEKKIAIEYCGLYWHSEQAGKDKNYHLTKLKMCSEKGYRLITILEDEWMYKKNIVKARLKHILGVITDRIYARNTSVREIDNSSYKIFVEANHIQGYVPAKHRYGLFHNGVLISVMAFGKRRRALGSTKSAGYELLRFCSSILVVGGASKLFSFASRHMDLTNVVSYCDLRWGMGDVYRVLGFTNDGLTKPGYFYVDGDKRYHRFKFRKSELVDIETYSKEKTEFEILNDAGYLRIWDCGHLRFSINTK